MGEDSGPNVNVIIHLSTDGTDGTDGSISAAVILGSQSFPLLCLREKYISILKRFLDLGLPRAPRSKLSTLHCARVGHPFFSKERNDLCVLFRSL